MIHRCPHQCPVCRGVGYLSAGFYTARSGGDVPIWSLSNASLSEECRTCGGTGAVWHDAEGVADGAPVATLEAREAPDLAKELAAWLDNNTVRCGHGGVMCGICWEHALRDGMRR